MNNTTLAKLRANISIIHKMASVWVMGVAGTVGTIWFALPSDQQVVLLMHAHVPMWVAPIVATVIGVVARIWPQKSITKEEAAAKSDRDNPETK